MSSRRGEMKTLKDGCFGNGFICACASVYTACVWVPRRPEQGFPSLGAEVTGSCGLLDMGAGN